MTVMCLSDLGQVITGNTPSKSIEDFYDSEDICFVKPSDFYSNSLSIIDKTENYLSEKAKCFSRIVPKESILVTCIGIIGKVAVLNRDAAFNQQINAIIPNKKKVLPLYLAYSLLSKQQELTWQANAAVVPIINKSQFSKLNLDIHDIYSQNKIVSVLSKVDTLTTEVKKQLEDFDLLIKSRFIEMFGDPVKNTLGWPIKTLGDISSLITNGNTPKGGSQNYVADGILFLRSQNVWRNRIDLEDVAYITKEIHDSLKKSSLHNRDILITKTGRVNTENSSLGRAALFVGEDNSANINGHVYLVRLKNGVIPEFVLSILVGEEYRRYIRKVCVGGIDKRQINLDQVEDFPIILPPVQMQQRFVDFVAQVDKSKLAVQQSLNELETLKKSLMQQYFG